MLKTRGEIREERERGEGFTEGRDAGEFFFALGDGGGEFGRYFFFDERRFVFAALDVPSFDMTEDFLVQIGIDWSIVLRDLDGIGILLREALDNPIDLRHSHGEKFFGKGEFIKRSAH